MTPRAVLLVILLTLRGAPISAWAQDDQPVRVMDEETARRKAEKAAAAHADAVAQKEAQMRADSGPRNADEAAKAADARKASEEQARAAEMRKEAETARERMAEGRAARASTTAPAHPTTAEASESIECVVIAKRLPDPLPQPDKPPETFITIRVLQTMKGIDEAGMNIRLLPKDLPPVNESYLYTYQRNPGFEWAEMTGGEPPTSKRVKAIADQARAAGGVLPRRAVWLRISTGLADAQVDDLWAAEDGRFVLTRIGAATADGPAKPQIATGTLDRAAIKELIPTPSTAAPPAPSFDVGRIAARWIDNSGALQWRLLGARDPGAADLIKRVQDIAARHGIATTAPTRSSD